tara:strand:+ start:61100 stop:62017 length:918 start_codon:yes stop_codon:yes gene_type:complete
MLGFISHAECKLHDPGAGHPDTPKRLDVIDDALIASGLSTVMRFFDAEMAERKDLARVHDDAYIDTIFKASSASGSVALDDDTVLSPDTLNAALRAAGAGVQGVDLVMQGDVDSVFCAVRPPGHHAERGKAMGFCIFNNVAVAVAHAMEEYGLTRVAVVDFDVHHGNGTEDIFADDPRVLVCSIFQYPFYPHTGLSSKSSNIINIPLPAGTSGGSFRDAVKIKCLPALDAFKPQLICVSAGFDGHEYDDMSGFALREDDYAWITRRIVDAANRHANGRIVSMLEGGYEYGALARSVVSHLKALMG